MTEPSKDFVFAARYPGELGNSILVSVGTSTNFSNWKYSHLFDSAPDTNEIHIVVVDTKGKFADSFEGNILKTYSYLSLNENSKNEFGEYNYYQYESSENTLQLYPNASLISQEEFDEIVKENELIKDEKDSMTMYFYIACGVAVVTSIFGIVGFVNANKYKNRLLTRNRFSESND